MGNVSRTKNTIGAERWKRESLPIAKFAAENRGFRTMLEAKIRARFRSPDKNWRVMLGVWITDNDERRTEPLAGTAMVLLDEARKLMAGWPDLE